MKIKLTFTEEHIALIKAMNFSQIDFEEILKSYDQYNIRTRILLPNGGEEDCTVGDVLEKYHIGIDSVYGFDNFNLWGGSFLWEQIAWIIGIHDHAYPDTLEDPTGAKFPPEDMEHMIELDSFIVTHLKHIVDLLLQFCTEGIQPGVTYWCYDYQNIWHKEEDKK